MDATTLLELHQMHREIPAALDVCYDGLRRISQENGYDHPWSIPTDVAPEILHGAALREYEEIRDQERTLKNMVREKVIEIFMELKEEAHWTRCDLYPEGTMGDIYTRTYRASIGGQYELRIHWNNMPIDATNSIDVRIVGDRSAVRTSHNVRTFLGIPYWIDVTRTIVDVPFPRFGPVTAGPPEEGAFTRVDEEHTTPPEVREAIRTLYSFLRKTLG